MSKLNPNYTRPRFDNGKWYRRLDKGEIVEPGDEYRDDDGKWKPVPEHVLGKGVSDPDYDPHVKFRRPISDDYLHLHETFRNYLRSLLLGDWSDKEFDEYFEGILKKYGSKEYGRIS